MEINFYFTYSTMLQTTMDIMKKLHQRGLEFNEAEDRNI